MKVVQGSSMIEVKQISDSQRTIYITFADIKGAQIFKLEIDQDSFVSSMFKKSSTPSELLITSEYSNLI